MQERTLFWAYDMAENTNHRYGKFNLHWAPGKGLISTAGSSTTVTSDTSGAFADVKVGDLLRVLTSPYGANGPTFSTVKIVTVSSTSEIVVSTALDLTAAGPWQYLISEVPATGVDAGWFYVGDLKEKTVHPVVTTVSAAGGIDLTIEGKTQSGMISTLYSVNYAAATDEVPIPVEESVEFLRVGLKGGSGFAGTDVVDVFFNGTGR